MKYRKKLMLNFKSQINFFILVGIYFFYVFLIKIMRMENKKKVWLDLLKFFSIPKTLLVSKLGFFEKFIVRPKEMGDVYVLFPKFRESIIAREIKKLDRESIFLDLGAHIGRYSILASKYAKKVYAIEANLQNYELLSKNILHNDLKNVTAINVAVSDKNGFVKLYDLGSSSLHSLFCKSNSKKFSKVKTRTIEKLFSEKNIDHISLVKIDIEGAEYKLLKSSKNCFPLIDSLLVEVHTNYGISIKKIEDLLENQGYSCKNHNNIIHAFK